MVVKSTKISLNVIVDLCFFYMSCNDSVLNNNYQVTEFFLTLVVKKNLYTDDLFTISVLDFVKLKTF